MSDSRLGDFFFTGEPKRKLNPRFGQAVSAECKEELIRKLQEERGQREFQRRKVQAAVTIQSWWRGCVCRRNWAQESRRSLENSLQNCDCDQLSSAEMFSKLKQFTNYFDCKYDVERLIWFGQKILSRKDEFIQSKTYSVVMARFLGFMVRYLALPGMKIAVPLRCLEQLFYDHPSGVDSLITKHLLEAGYFIVMRSLIDTKIPSDFEQERFRAPVPIAESLLKAVIKPLALVEHYENDARSAVVKNFLVAFMYLPFTYPLRYYILPSAARGLSTNAALLVELLHQAEVMKIDSKIGMRFLYLILIFLNEAKAANRIDLHQLSARCLPPLARTLPCLLALLKNRKLDTTDIAGSLKSCLDEQLFPVDSASWMCCVNLLNSSAVVDVLLSAVDFALIQYNSDDFPMKLFNVSYELIKIEKLCCCGFKVLNCLSFNAPFIIALWNQIQSVMTTSVTGRQRCLDLLQRGYRLSAEERQRFLPPLVTFSHLFANLLMVVTDDDFRGMRVSAQNRLTPFTLHELALVSLTLRNVALGLIDLAFPPTRLEATSCSYFLPLPAVNEVVLEDERSEWNYLFMAVVRLLRLLYNRDERLHFCLPGQWCRNILVSIQSHRLLRCAAASRYMYQLPVVAAYPPRLALEEAVSDLLPTLELKTLTILRYVPFVMPFEDRVALFYRLIENDQRKNGHNLFFGVNVHIRRNYIYEDAMEKLSPEAVSNLKIPVRVTLANWAGALEAGVDGGGVFREFLNELLKNGFNPGRGLFAATEHEHHLYPNPLSPVIFPDFRQHYYFLGRMIGKMIYENQRVELSFARFFLSRLLSRNSSDVDFNLLASLDPVIYRSLLDIQEYPSDVSELELDFSVIIDEFGSLKTHDLKPNGRNIRVTSENRLEYVYLLSSFYLNQQIKAQTAAFLQGLSCLIDLDWLMMFDCQELQILISGIDREIDIEDLRRNTVYTGTTENHEGICMFWDVVRTFTNTQKKKLLKFVTSCSRPPLFGFKDMFPPFCVQLLLHEEDRLPTSATCMHLLKLPFFKDSDTLRQKLLYAIEFDSGFELS